MASPLSEEVSTKFSSMAVSKHITPIDLENIVKSVTESKQLEPLDPLPPSLCISVENVNTDSTTITPETVIATPSNQQATSPPKLNAESSTSTMATAVSHGSQISNMMSDSAATEVSGTSIVRGFSRDNISRSRISRSQLAPPQPLLRSQTSLTTTSPIPTRPAPLSQDSARKRPVMFHLGASEEDSSPESFAARGGFLTESLRSSLRKTTSLNDRIQPVPQASSHEEAITDSDDEAVEDEDEWEDEPELSAQQDQYYFQRVDSSSNLTTKRSLLTTMMHEQDRASAMQNAASKSTSAIRRRTSSNGPSGSSSSNERIQLSRAPPMNIPISTTNTTEPLRPASPRTNRRNMLSTELTGSLRKHLIWERQSRNPAAKAIKNRGYKSEVRLTDMYKTSPEPGPSSQSVRRNESIDFYDNGLQEYYDKGW
jgi:hypothetical protein